MAGRKALMTTVTDLFFEQGGTLSDRERTLMTEILRQLIHDVEMSVRLALAERLARQPAAPRELVTALANDQIEVAHPILLHSEVLQDVELIEIVQHRTLEHQLAIAMRSSVSEPVSDALVATGHVDVVKTLLENRSAAISAKALDYLVEQSKRVDSYQNPLLSRPELGPDLARRMYWWVSAALRRHILDHYSLSEADIDEALEETVAPAVDALVDDQAARKSMQLADTLAGQEQITPALLVQTLRDGEIALFEALFSRLTGLRLPLVRRLLFDAGGEGLAVACRTADIEPSVFASIFVLSRKARPYAPGIERGDIKRILTFYDRLTRSAAESLVRKWQTNPHYLQAMWQVDRSQRAHG
ncbi:MAG TPA: DUF2336 domain-containing protein [Stellaceae bacterium]